MNPRRPRNPHPLAAARHRLGLSQIAIAARAGCHPSYLAAVEQGRRPSDALAAKLAAAVGAPVEAIWPKERQP